MKKLNVFHAKNSTPSVKLRRNALLLDAKLILLMEDAANANLFGNLLMTVFVRLTTVWK